MVPGGFGGFRLVEVAHVFLRLAYATLMLGAKLVHVSLLSIGKNSCQHITPTRNRRKPILVLQIRADGADNVLDYQRVGDGGGIVQCASDILCL